MALQISSYLMAFSVLNVRSTQETLTVGTLKDIPVSFPFRTGRTSPQALAAPVDDGMMFTLAALPALQSFPPFDGPSTVCWVAVIEWQVVMSPSVKVKLSLITFAMGAKQLVVQEALDTISISAL